MEDLKRQLGDLKNNMEVNLTPVTGDADSAQQANFEIVVFMKVPTQAILNSVESALNNSSAASTPEIFLDDVHKALSSLDSSTSEQKKDADPQIADLTKKLNSMYSLLGKLRNNTRDTLNIR